MATKTDKEWREIIMERLAYWLRIISGKEITPKKKSEMRDITDQVMEGLNKNRIKRASN